MRIELICGELVRTGSSEGVSSFLWNIPKPEQKLKQCMQN